MNIKAKEASKWGQIFSAVFIAGWTSYMFFTQPDKLTVPNIVGAAIIIPLCFTPVLASIIIDKIKGTSKDLTDYTKKGFVPND